MDECTKWCGGGYERGFSCLEKWQNKVIFLKLIYFSPQFFEAIASIYAYTIYNYYYI